MADNVFIDYCKSQAQLNLMQRIDLEGDAEGKIKSLGIQAFSFVPYLDGLGENLRVFNYGCCADRGFSGEMFYLRENTRYVSFFAGGGENKLNDMLKKVLTFSNEGPIAAIYTDRAYKLPVLMLMNNGIIERYSKLITTTRFEVMVGEGYFNFKQNDYYTTQMLQGVPCGLDLEEKMIATLREHNIQNIIPNLNSDVYVPLDVEKVISEYILNWDLEKTSPIIVVIDGKKYVFPTYPVISGGDTYVDDVKLI